MLPPNLCYTLALDHPGQDVYWRMARLLVTSLLRTGWPGRIVVFRNSSRPVLGEPRPQVDEFTIEPEPGLPWDEAVSWKYRLRDRLNLEGIGKVLFLDCDCLALRNLDHLMRGGWDIYTAPEPGRIVETPFNGYLTDDEMFNLGDRPGLNSGAFGIRASRYTKMMEMWERIDASQPARRSKNREQHAWNRLVLDTLLRHRSFVPGEVQFPFLHRAVYADYRRAAVIHAADRSPEEKFSFLYGLWVDVFGRSRFEDIVGP
jgi:hypothetical protein